MSQYHQHLPKDLSLNNIVAESMVAKKGSYGDIMVNGLGAREIDVVSLTVADDLTVSALTVDTINGDVYPPETGNVYVDPLEPTLTGEHVVIGANSDNQIRTADGVTITGMAGDILNVDNSVNIGTGLDQTQLLPHDTGVGAQSFRFPAHATTTGQLLAGYTTGETIYSNLIVLASSITSTSIHNGTLTQASGIASGTQLLFATGGVNCTLEDNGEINYLWTKVGKILTISGYAKLDIVAPGTYSMAFTSPLMIKGSAIPNVHRIGCTLYNVVGTHLPPFIFPDDTVPTNVLKLEGVLEDELMGAGQIVELCFSGQFLLDDEVLP
jgi:hypothetical protein